jgi:hypothetical protein
MADTFNLLTNQTQDVDGPAVFYPVAASSTVQLTLTGDPSGGTVYVDAFDPVESVWNNVPGLTLPPGTTTASVTGVSAAALRAHLNGSLTPNLTVTAQVTP